MLSHEPRIDREGGTLRVTLAPSPVAPALLRLRGRVPGIRGEPQLALTESARVVAILWPRSDGAPSEVEPEPLYDPNADHLMLWLARRRPMGTSRVVAIPTDDSPLPGRVEAHLDRDSELVGLKFCAARDQLPAEFLEALRDASLRGRDGRSTDDAQWDPWPLTAPESYLLRYSEYGVHADVVFNLAVKELIARRALRLEGARIPRRRVPGRRMVWMLAEGPRLEAIDEPALLPVVELYRDVCARRGYALTHPSEPDREVDAVTLADLAREGLRRFRGFGRYVDAVSTALQDRGLWREPGSPTKRGRAADRRLDRLLDLARHQLPEWEQLGHRDRAFAFTRSAGAALLLNPGTYPIIARLSQHVPAAHVDNQGFAVVAGGADASDNAPVVGDLATDTFDGFLAIDTIDGVVTTLDLDFAGGGDVGGGGGDVGGGGG